MTVRESMQQIFNQMFRFSIIGVLGSCINYLVFVFALSVFSVQYQVAGAIGFISAIPVAFILNKSWSFKSKKSTFIALPIYFVSNFVALLAHIAIQYYVVAKLGFSFSASQFFGIAGSATINFILSRYVAFRDDKNREV